jgi:hypothetical protein
MNLEVPRALVTFDPDHPNALDLVIALEAKFGSQFLRTPFPGSAIIILRKHAPDADALLIMEETVGQDCPALICYPRLYR